MYTQNVDVYSRSICWIEGGVSHTHTHTHTQIGKEKGERERASFFIITYTSGLGAYRTVVGGGGDAQPCSAHALLPWCAHGRVTCEAHIQQCDAPALRRWTGKTGFAQTQPATGDGGWGEGRRRKKKGGRGRGRGTPSQVEDEWTRERVLQGGQEGTLIGGDGDFGARTKSLCGLCADVRGLLSFRLFACLLGIAWEGSAKTEAGVCRHVSVQ